MDGVELRLEGFHRKNWHQGLQCILPGSSDAQKTFDNFYENLSNAIGRRYLPVYRMADGEFLFCLGWRRPLSTPDYKRFDFAREYYHGLREKLRRLHGFGTMWGENYTLLESIRGRRRLPNLVRAIAREGVLGLYFMRRGDLWGEEFILPMLKWFKRHDIELTPKNYVPFYMVYAALSRGRELLNGRRVLVATGLTPERRAGIEAGLKRMGARGVEFIDVSANKSLFQPVSTERIAEPPDLVLVGAGIGSANIIVQLSAVAAPVIDAGIYIEGLIDPKRLEERPFLA